MESPTNEWKSQPAEIRSGGAQAEDTTKDMGRKFAQISAMRGCCTDIRCYLGRCCTFASVERYIAEWHHSPTPAIEAWRISGTYAPLSPCQFCSLKVGSGGVGNIDDPDMVKPLESPEKSLILALGADPLCIALDDGFDTFMGPEDIRNAAFSPGFISLVIGAILEGPPL
jgi:hypothetical protein